MNRTVSFKKMQEMMKYMENRPTYAERLHVLELKEEEAIRERHRREKGGTKVNAIAQLKKLMQAKLENKIEGSDA